ncbi:MAG: tRNA (N(6)-L-threonylcarbamoyladenosine(37)-C(2))-methylthiotransferase [Crenarchaeota archaeon]|nr:tRNA (N(6)-L-threonylcarbamoyladenosine(37)-C(2))-methylthiotransferase [Thermoproteota archaeon]
MKVCIEVFGCALNRSDAMYARELLEEAGFEITDDLAECDTVVVFTCIVRRDSELRSVRRISDLCKAGKRVVVAGCLASALPAEALRYCKDASLLTPSAVSDIVGVVKGLKKVAHRDTKVFDRVPRVVRGSVATIAVSDGCLDECSFCIVKRARPYLKSAPIDKVVEAIKKALRDGAVEIELTAQDLAVYGVDLYGTYALPELLERILEIDEDFRLRLGQMNPRHLAQIIDRVIDALKDPRVYKHLHIPIQSGCDRILNLMNRKHSAELFREIVKEFRRKIENVHIATDIIVGFPTERESEFLESAKLIIEMDIDRVHIARYSPRPLTKAYSMPQVPEPIKKARSSYLESIYELHALSKNLEFINAVSEGYAVEYDPDRRTVTARLSDYRSVVLRGTKDIVGKKIRFRITEATFFDLRGRIMEVID